MKYKKLLVISHTEHYKDLEGMVLGFGATVNELDYLADYWQEVVHIGCLYPSEAPKSALHYTKKNILFVPIPPYGGKTFLDKMGIIFKIPKIISQVSHNIKGATEVQLRLPTSIGLFLLPLFSFFLPRKYTLWVKYAGNWNQRRPPFSYRIQRFWLRKNLTKCKVTLNGFWDNQPCHCISFENPCLTEIDIATGKKIAQQKSFKGNFTFCFVGRLDESKGVDVILESLKSIDLSRIDAIHFIGDGNRTEFYKQEVSFLKEKVVFHGFLGKGKVHELLAKSHFLLLPSQSEGFPKVIAEAACYGTIPIVSNVGSISHYVNNSNGYLWDRSGVLGYDEIISKAIQDSKVILSDKSSRLSCLAEKFTFANYILKLQLLFNGD